MAGRVVKDSGWSPKLKALFKKYDLTVGIHVEDNGRNDQGLTNAQVGAFHEFPNSRVPQRPFLRPTFDEKQNDYRKYLSRAYAQIAKRGGDPKTALELIGMRVASDVKNRIRDGIPPTLKASTVKRKGSSTPLIDTGQMLNSIDFQVHEKYGSFQQGVFSQIGAIR